MHITCQECDTIFNLDERLLKASGSKVRCSLCKAVFMAYPPVSMAEPEPLNTKPAESSGTFMASAAEMATGVEVDQKLQGIDISELDAIFNSEPAATPSTSEPGADSASLNIGQDQDSFDDADLDLDFDMDLDSSQGAVMPAATEPVTPEPKPAAEASDVQDADALLEEGDLEMAFDLETDRQTGDVEGEGPGQAQSSAPEDDGDELDLNDEPQEAEAQAEMELDDFDLDELTLEQDDLGASSEQGDEPLTADVGEPTPAAVEKRAPEAAETKKESESNDLDLDDLSFLDNLPELDEPQLKEPSGIEEELELASDEQDDALEALPEIDTALDGGPGLELDLDFDLEDQKPEPAPKAQDEALELDFGEPEELSPEELFPKDERLPEATHKAAQSEPVLQDEGDDLDLTDLTSILEDDLEEEEGLAPVSVDEELELELDLPETIEAQKESAAEEVEDLSFELDAEVEDKPISKTAGAAVEQKEDQELDLSDIEQMLEGDSVESDLAATLGAASEAGTPEQWKAEADLVPEPDEFDLSELEAAIDAAPANADKSKKAVQVDEDLTLDISLEDEQGKASAAESLDFELELESGAKEKETDLGDLELNLELEDDTGRDDLKIVLDNDTIALKKDEKNEKDEFDLSDLGDLVEEPKSASRAEKIDTGDIELEFEVAEDEEPELQPASTKTVSNTAAIPAVEALAAKPAQSSKPVHQPRPMKKKKGTSKALILVLILALLGAGLYFGYDYARKQGIAIPYLDEYLNPKPKDPSGILNLSTLDISAKFMENEQAGRLFVVSGKVRNRYDHTRGMILLNGNLFGQAKRKAKQTKAFAGIIIPDQELAGMTADAIQQRLSSPQTPQSAETKVQPGQDIPFMIVFSNLPDDLDEYAIELVQSQKVQ